MKNLNQYHQKLRSGANKMKDDEKKMQKIPPKEEDQFRPLKLIKIDDSKPPRMIKNENQMTDNLINLL